MTTLVLYPTSSYNVATFVDIANVYGNTTSYATATTNVANNVSAGSASLYFNMTDIPEDATISAIKLSIVSRVSSANTRSVYSSDHYAGTGDSSTQMITMDTNLSATNSTVDFVFTPSKRTTAGWRNNSLGWSTNFLSKTAGSYSVYWEKAYITVEYTQPTSSNMNVLFFGDI